MIDPGQEVTVESLKRVLRHLRDLRPESQMVVFVGRSFRAKLETERVQDISHDLVHCVVDDETVQPDDYRILEVDRWISRGQ